MTSSAIRPSHGHSVAIHGAQAATLCAVAAATGRRRKALHRDRRFGRRVPTVALAADGREGIGILAGSRASGVAGVKVVHFIRHAEAMVNAAGRKFPKDDPRKKAVRKDVQFFDSPLSEEGLSQCQQLSAGTLAGRSPLPSGVQLVAASPLTRALQTASTLFGCGASPSAPPLSAMEALREFCSKDYQPCDSRRAPAELVTSFPHVDFSQVPQGPDGLLGEGLVETPESADARIQSFFAWLRQRPEKQIAVVAHMQILTRVFKEYLQPAGWDSTGYGDLTNLEIRSVAIAFQP